MPWLVYMAVSFMPVEGSRGSILAAEKLVSSTMGVVASSIRVVDSSAMVVASVVTLAMWW